MTVKEIATMANVKLEHSHYIICRSKFPTATHILTDHPTTERMRQPLLSTALLSTAVANSAAAFGILSSIAPAKATTRPKSKTIFLESLETLERLNVATKEQTKMVKDLTQDNPTSQPGSTEGFQPFAPGLWSVIYAPHISTMSRLVGNGFSPVYYDLQNDGTMVSHARFDVNVPFIRTSGWLSVSGNYSTQDNDRVCRVDFDKAWMKWNDNNTDGIDTDEDDAPYACLEDVPPSWEKTVIQTLGKWLFIDSFSVFPVSYLDDDLIVFDFELLGTRICARKIKKTN